MRPMGTLQGGVAEINILPRQKSNLKLNDLFFHLEDNVMRQQSGQISTRQEDVLKNELKHLGNEIACRAWQM